MTRSPSMTTLSEEVAEVVRGLTKAQRDALLSAQEKNDGPLLNSRWLCRNAARVRASLLAKRLVYLAVPMFSWRSDRRDIVLTPLGLAVRASLTASAGGE